MSDFHEEGHDLRTCCPRGGPNYSCSLVGPLTSICQFESTVQKELMVLDELCTGSTQECDEDLSIEDLKFFSEEELVNKALEALQDAEKDQSSLEKHSNKKMHEVNMCSQESRAENLNAEAHDSSTTFKNVSLSTFNSASAESRTEFSFKPRKKRGRVFDRCARAAELQNSYVGEVEKLAKIKEKQEKDKATARLHALRGSTQIIESPLPIQKKTDRMKSLSFISNMKVDMVKPSRTDQYVPLQHPKVVLCIEIYHNKLHKKNQEFLVLGTQTLSELRDSIYCPTDEGMRKLGQYDPSGYFLIEDVFYNDLRDPSSIDYSEPILDWLQNCKDNATKKWDYILMGQTHSTLKEWLEVTDDNKLPRFKTSIMHKTQFLNLRFRLGFGYLYCHQGDCKHIFVIRDMRLIHPEDTQNREAYPLLLYHFQPRHAKCSVCRIYRATKVTIDDKWAQENPCYFCDNCYYLLHYSEDGSLIYDDFTVYDYHNEL